MVNEKCEKHGCEKELRLMTIGWGKGEFSVCPVCAGSRSIRAKTVKQESDFDPLEGLRQELMFDH